MAAVEAGVAVLVSAVRCEPESGEVFDEGVDLCYL